MARTTKPVQWIKAALKEFEAFPAGVKLEGLRALTVAAEGGKADIVKPLKGFDSGVMETFSSIAETLFAWSMRYRLGRTSG